MILSVNGISFNYKSKKTLSNIEFKVNKNEIISILGPNGAGKTTLLKCINRILKPYKGTIFLNEENILNYSQNRIAQNISYVSQKTESNKLTVFDTILLGRKPHIQFNVGDKDLKIVQSIIKILNLENIALRYTEEISGGELQKVSIARALVQEPKIILMDEPTASLDLKNQQEILILITDISKFHEASTIMTVHDINTALRYSDRILFLKDGLIYAQIKPDEVNPEIIEEVYDVKVNIHEFENYRHIFPL
jgi:iron complex transport system ATP-binding protein